MQTEKKGMNISARSFLTAILVILVLMIASYILTLVIPSGSYARADDGEGHMVIDTEGGFASGVCNPFTVGAAQQLAGLSMCSGAWLRAAGILLFGLAVGYN